MRETSESDPHVAVEQLVKRHREPHATLEKLAEKLGVQRIIATRMRFDGGVFNDGLGLAIKLNSDSSRRRQRFTLAHELAHLILSSGSAVGARRSHGSTQLEQACDCVAAELLMPSSEFRSFSPPRASTAGLVAVSDHFDVSLHAAAVRLHELRIWNDSVGQWSWDGKARELWFVGRRVWPDRTVRMRTFELAVSQGSEYSGWEWIEGQRESDGFPAFLDVRRLGRDKFYLLAVCRKASAQDLGTLKARSLSREAARSATDSQEIDRGQ
jgi:Zn-dependent peptidase ImmA (M78 family)